MDCADPAAVASFWNEALHWGGVTVTDDETMARSAAPVGGGPYLEFVQVPEGEGR